MFDRFDVCEAWYLHLSANHGGQGSKEYARLSRMSRYFTPKQSLRGACDLSSNGLEIYLKLAGVDVPLVDAGMEGNTLFEMWAGAYATTKALVRADSLESAFEAFVEYLDDHAPGMLTQIDYDAAARELGFASWDSVYVESEWTEDAERVSEHAEMDMTVIGHTTLKHGNAIASHEWGGHESDV